MKFAILFISPAVALLLASILYDVNYFDYEKPIPYAQMSTIKFHDFKALKKPGVTLYGVAEFAYIKTNRKIHYLNDGNVEVTTCFHPSRSYVFAQDIRNIDLLTHELYHFHISEYCSRLLRKEIFEKGNKITRKGIKNLNKKYYRLEDAMQDNYDEDTYHSYVLQKQKGWEEKVDNLLLSLEDFSNPIVICGRE
jgi:hypothetical protein